MAMGPDGTAYFVRERASDAFEVEVVKPGRLPEFIKGFASAAAAEQWIFSRLAPHGAAMPGNLRTP